MSANYRLVFDGGADPNPGKGYGSYQFEHIPTGKTRLERFDIEEGDVTNNEAEWLTLIQALHRLRSLLGARIPATRLEIVGDSRLVINTLSQGWNCNPRLAHLRDAVKSLLNGFVGWSCQWMGRDSIVEVLGH